MASRMPGAPKRSNITYLSRRGKISGTSSGDESQLAGGGRSAPPSSRDVVYFERGTAIPQSDDLAVLRRQARRMQKNPAARLLIRGYSNRRRADDGARALARSRAEIVRKLLIAFGANRHQLETEVGDIYRVTEAPTRTSRAKNRRVVLKSRSLDTGVSFVPSLFSMLGRGRRMSPRRPA